MTHLARIFSVCLLTVFLFGTVAQVAAAGTMSMDMYGAAHAEMDASSCDGCDDEGLDGSSNCGGTCVAAQLAALPAEWADPATDGAVVYACLEATFQNWAEPPARTPPRSAFLM